ncbi:MAG: hypothetical protein ACK55Z_37560, partial [bacterium]
RSTKSKNLRTKTLIQKFLVPKFIRKDFSMNNIKQDKRKFRKAFSWNMDSSKVQQTIKGPTIQKRN